MKHGTNRGLINQIFVVGSTYMVRLADIQKQAKELSEEDRERLVAFLLHSFSGAPSGPDDEEVERRDTEMDSGVVIPISHNEFLAQVGRSGR